MMTETITKIVSNLDKQHILKLYFSEKVAEGKIEEVKNFIEVHKDDREIITTFVNSVDKDILLKQFYDIYDIWGKYIDCTQVIKKNIVNLLDNEVFQKVVIPILSQFDSYVARKLLEKIPERITEWYPQLSDDVKAEILMEAIQKCVDYVGIDFFWDLNIVKQALDESTYEDTDIEIITTHVLVKDFRKYWANDLVTHENSVTWLRVLLEECTEHFDIWFPVIQQNLPEFLYEDDLELLLLEKVPDKICCWISMTDKLSNSVVKAFVQNVDVDTYKKLLIERLLHND